MPNVGYGALQVIPSMRGIEDLLRRQLVAPAEAAGADAGEAAGDGLKNKIKAGAVAAGVAAGAVLVAGIVKAIDQANISGTLQAQLGTSSKVAAQQGKLAGKLYSTGVSGSFQEAADAIKATVQAGLAPPDATTKQLEQIATKAADVAGVFEQDLGGVTNAVSQMLRTGLAKNASEAFDVLTKGFQSGANKADDLLDTFNEYGTQFRKLGLDGEQALGIINQLVRAGARDSDLAADALKEFSIRAVDMSATSKDAYKSLGLNAAAMSAQIAKGGDSATSGLATVIDRLRAMDDPLKREAAAVGLFGTQAEDLGEALFALDPKTAVKSLGKVGGAADKLGTTIRSGPGHELEIFKRRLEQGFVEFLGGRVLPVITEVGLFLNHHVVPPLRTLGSITAAILLPALAGLWKTGAAVVDWLRDMGVWLIPIGILLAGLAISMSTTAIATGTLTAVLAAYTFAAKVVAAVTRVWAGAQAVFNAVMAANPIVLVIAAVIALGVALVIAYKKSETFRNIVQAAWSGIQQAAMAAWRFLKPAFDGLVLAFRAVAAAATWLWQNILSPVIGFIVKALKVLLFIALIVVFGPIIVAVKVLAAIFTWLWHNAIGPALRGIGAAFSWLWGSVIKPVLGLITAGIRVWWTGIKVIFGLVRTYLLGPLGTAFTWLWKNAVKPAFDGIAAVVGFAWRKGIKPQFDLVKKGVAALRDSFKTAVDGIGRLWSGLEDKLRGPAQFVVDVIYNNGIRSVWNTVAGLVGLKKLGKVSLGGSSKGMSNIPGAGKPQVLATGGILPGYTPGRDIHLAALSGGEAVMRPEWTRAVGPGYVNAMNAAARGGGVGGVQRALGLPGFASGGIVGDLVGGLVGVTKKVGGWVGDGFDILTNPSAMWDKATGFIRDKLKDIGESQWAQALGRMPLRLLSGLKDKLLGTAKGLFGGASGGFGAAVKFARSQAGKPYGWGAVGPRAYDCSGLMGAIQNVIMGRSPYRRVWATGSFGASGPAGWKRGLKAPFTVGITNAGVGHTAGTLGGVNVESSGGVGVRFGGGARGTSNGLFTSRWGFVPSLGPTKYDTGGVVPPGLHSVYNGTRKPEALLTNQQWSAVMDRTRGSDGTTFHYTINARTADVTYDDLQHLQRVGEARDRAGRPR